MEHLEQGHGGSCPETDRAISCISATEEACFLLAGITDQDASKQFVTRYGRGAWWRLLVYGLGGTSPALGATLDPPIRKRLEEEAETKHDMRLEEEAETKHDMIVVELPTEKTKPDTEFEEKLKLGCCGADLLKRRSGLHAVLKHLSTEEFRLSRLRYVIERVISEPEHTKQTVVPAILHSLRDVQEFVLLAKDLEPLWQQVTNCNPKAAFSFNTMAVRTLEEVIKLRLVPHALGATLARAVMVSRHGNPDQLQAMLAKNAKSLLPHPQVLTYLIEGMEAATTPGEQYSAKVLQLTLLLVQKTSLTPSDMLKLPWASPLHKGLAGNDPRYVLVEVLSLLTSSKEFEWSPLAASQTKSALDSARQGNPTEGAKLLCERLTLLQKKREAMRAEHKSKPNKAEALDETALDESVVDTAETLRTILTEAVDQEVASCHAVLLGSEATGLAAWPVGLSPQHVLKLGLAVLDRVSFTSATSTIVKKQHEHLLSILTDAQAKLEVLVERLAVRSDALYAVAMGSALCLYLVQHRPAKLRDLLAAFIEAEDLTDDPVLITSETAKPSEAAPSSQSVPSETSSSSSDTGGLTLRTELAAVLEPVLAANHLPEQTAATLSRFLLKSEGRAPSVCLAHLMREIDLVAVLTKRMLAMELQDATAVLQAAAAAGHPVRTLQLVTGATELKTAAHRDVFDRALGALPNRQARQTIADVLKKPATGPSVTKRCLRLVRDMRLAHPQEMMQQAWREGKCHPDVLVFLMQSLSGDNTVDEDKTLSTMAKHVFEIARVQEKDVKYVTGELLTGLNGKSWDSVPLLQFLVAAIDAGGTTPSIVFNLLLDRLVLSGADTASVQNAPFAAAGPAIDVLASLLQRSAVLSRVELHGLSDVANAWQGCQVGDRRLYEPRFSTTARHVQHATVQQLLRTIAAASSCNSELLFKLWAQALLRPADASSTLQEQLQFALALCSQYKMEQQMLARAAVERVIQIDPPNTALHDAALELVSKAFSNLKAKPESNVSFKRWYLEQLSALAVAQPVEEDVLQDIAAVLATAQRLDVEERKTHQQHNLPTQSSLQSDSHQLTLCALRALHGAKSTIVDTQANRALQLLKWLTGSEVHNLDEARQLTLNMALEVLSTKRHAAALAQLLLHHHVLYPSFPDTLFSFDEKQAMAWVQHIVKEMEDMSAITGGGTPRQILTFSERITRAAANTVLLKSQLGAVRAQALRFLTVEQLDMLAESDRDYEPFSANDRPSPHNPSQKPNKVQMLLSSRT
eukprot:g10667.t1